MTKKSEQVVNITDVISVDVEVLREQRNTLLDVVEVLVNSRRDDVEDFFAFDRDEALYDGVLLNQPFRSVIKTFQVVTWRELCGRWQALSQESQQRLTMRYSSLGEFSQLE